MPTHVGGAAVRVTGLSELVPNHEAVFVTSLDDVQETRPEDTQLVFDDSPQCQRSRLYVKAFSDAHPPPTTAFTSATRRR